MAQCTGRNPGRTGGTRRRSHHANSKAWGPLRIGSQTAANPHHGRTIPDICENFGPAHAVITTRWRLTGYIGLAIRKILVVAHINTSESKYLKIAGVACILGLKEGTSNRKTIWKKCWSSDPGIHPPSVFPRVPIQHLYQPLVKVVRFFGFLNPFRCWEYECLQVIPGHGGRSGKRRDPVPSGR